MFASTSAMVSNKVFTAPRPHARFVRTFAQRDDGITKEKAVQAVEEVKSTLSDKAAEAQEVATNNTSFAQDAKSSLEPRVDELRNSQLSDGLSNKEDIMSFSGPLPELVNGRLAMLGFTACMAAELYSHQTLWEQVKAAPGSIALAFAIFGVASIIPIMRGTDVFPPKSEEGNFKSGFTITNELINGRAAMLGFVIIAVYEVIKGSPIFPAAM